MTRPPAAIHDAMAAAPTFDALALYFALDDQRIARDRDQRRRDLRKAYSWRQVSAESGVSPSTLTRLSQGHCPDAHSLVRLLTWLGTTDVKPFITTPTEETTSR